MLIIFLRNSRKFRILYSIIKAIICLLQTKYTCNARFKPLISFEVLQLNSQHVILVICQHVDVLVTKPELLAWIPEAILVICPVPVEVLWRDAEVVSTLDNLKFASIYFFYIQKMAKLCVLRNIIYEWRKLWTRTTFPNRFKDKIVGKLRIPLPRTRTPYIRSLNRSKSLVNTRLI